MVDQTSITQVPTPVPSLIDPTSPPAPFTRPDVVLFFEGMPASFWHSAALVGDLEAGDVMIVVGTSCAVAPANTLPYAAMSHGCHVIEINLQQCLEEQVPIDSGDGGRPVLTYGNQHELRQFQTFLQGTAGTVLPALVSRVRDLQGQLDQDCKDRAAPP
mmetsp:Transcript_1132/g.1894  ORF Transcript_1132/g.1894 Transcript_1132/m.1894 type:complete len:159 (+) Transcript_1132:54-530(+)